jgi:hypothetical protein
VARNYDGIDDDISLPSGVSLALNDPVTVVFWGYTPGSLQTSAFTIGNLGDPNRCQVHAPWVDNTLYWDYGNSGGTGRVTVAFSSYLNKWTHVGLVSKGNGGDFKGIYLNGALVASGASSDGPDQAVSGGFIGAFPGNAARYTGRIAEFAVWNVVLLANEIASIAKGVTPTLVHPANLLGYWPLWGVASPEPDLSGNARNGTVNGGAAGADHAPVGPHAPQAV